MIAETISGSTAAMQRPGFAQLVDRLETGDVLIVPKLDRLGRNSMDVRATVEQLANEGCTSIVSRWARSISPPR